MLYKTDDLRIVNMRPLLPPAILMEELPATEKSSTTVARGREQAADVLHGRDDRLLAVVGPCSIHDPKAGLEYGARLHALADELSRDLLVEHVWGTEYDPDSNVVEGYVSYLRRKLQGTSAEGIIRTVRGLGYTLGAGEAGA